MIIRIDQAPVDRGTAEDEQTYGTRESLHLTEEGGLTQFVAHVQTLQPGSRSGDRHWHEEEDELLYVLSGEATVIEEDGPHTLHPGDAACWPAGVANAPPARHTRRRRAAMPGSNDTYRAFPSNAADRESAAQSLLVAPSHLLHQLFLELEQPLRPAVEAESGLRGDDAAPRSVE